MRCAIVVLLLVALPCASGRPPAARASVTIGNVAWNGKPTIDGTVPVALSLAATDTRFDSLGYVLTDLTPAKGGWIPVGLGIVPPPQPGKKPAVPKLYFNVKPGRKYKLEVTMNYIDAAGKPRKTTQTTTLTAP